MSELLDILRQYDEARLHINIALELDPFFYMYHLMSSIYYYHEGRLKESLEETKIESELSPGHEGPYWTAFYIYVKQGEDLKAVEALQKIMLMDSLTAKYANTVKEICNKSGISGLLNFLIETELNKPKPLPLSLAHWNVLLGKKEEALDWLEKSLEENAPSIPRINCIPDFEILRPEPRFQAMIRKMGLTEYQDPQ